MKSLERENQDILKTDDRICPICANVYEVVRKEQNEQSYGFGFFRCPTCGLFAEV
jgi:hypothetical protein